MKKIDRSDIAELVVGASVLAFPVAVTEEIWNLSEQIAPFNIFLIAAVSCVFLSVFIFYIHGEESDNSSRRLEIKRVIATYGVTLLVCAAILILLGKFPLLTDTAVALKRVVLVAFPASFSATVVDSLK
jgi:uncharacterized membrane protein